MATTALEVVPLLAMRRELRIEGDTNPDDDARLIGQIGAAVSDVSLDASAPLVEQPETIEAAVPYRDRPVAFTATVVRVVRQVRYWTPGAALRDEPDGTIADTVLGRLWSDWPASRHNRLYPPAAGWPAVLAGSRLWLDVTRGVPFLEWVDWPGFVQGLRDAAMVAYAAAQARSQDEMLNAADVLVTACGNCHDAYREVPGGVPNRCMQ